MNSSNWVSNSCWTRGSSPGIWNLTREAKASLGSQGTVDSVSSSIWSTGWIRSTDSNQSLIPPMTVALGFSEILPMGFTYSSLSITSLFPFIWIELLCYFQVRIQHSILPFSRQCIQSPDPVNSTSVLYLLLSHIFPLLLPSTPLPSLKPSHSMLGMPLN